MKTIEIVINEKPVVVKKLPIGKFAELLKSFEQLPKYMGQFANTKNEDIFGMIPTIIHESTGDVLKAVRVAVDMPEEDIQNLGVDDLIVIAEAVWEVNNLAFIFEKIKKIQAQPSPNKNPGPASQPEIGSTGQ